MANLAELYHECGIDKAGTYSSSNWIHSAANKNCINSSLKTIWQQGKGALRLNWGGFLLKKHFEGFALFRLKRPDLRASRPWQARTRFAKTTFLWDILCNCNRPVQSRTFSHGAAGHRRKPWLHLAAIRLSSKGRPDIRLRFAVYPFASLLSSWRLPAAFAFLNSHSPWIIRLRFRFVATHLGTPIAIRLLYIRARIGLRPVAVILVLLLCNTHLSAYWADHGDHLRIVKSLSTPRRSGILTNY